MNWTDRLAREAADRERAGLRRELRPRTPEEILTDLAGNDYLGLSTHPAVIAAASSALLQYGLGATGSRLVRGSTGLHEILERRLAEFLGCEAALVYSSGYLANLGAVRSLTRPGTRIASDAHNHASLVDGIRATGAPKVVVPHADVAAFDEALSGSTDGLLVTESVFSVDGDLAPLAGLAAVAGRYGAVLLVDDAHGFGLLGPRGAGGVAAAGLSDVVITATLSKSFGASGGVVAGPRALIRTLIDTGRTFIFDTALPPAVAAGALAALEVLSGPEGDASRRELHDRAAFATERLRKAGLTVSDPDAGVLSVTAAGPEEAVAWAARCRADGVAVGCFRPPSVPDGKSRLRLTINTGVERSAFERAVDTVTETAP